MVISITNISELELMSINCGALESICSVSVRHSGGLEGVSIHMYACVCILVWVKVCNYHLRTQD